MTKTISIYAAQIMLGVIVIAAGYAKLSGAGLMVQQFQVLGLGKGFLMTAGMAEIAAGLCLMLPRGGFLGAVLLSCVMVGTLGFGIGHVASSATAPVTTTNYMNSSYRAVAKSGRHDAGMVLTIQRKTEWSI